MHSIKSACLIALLFCAPAYADIVQPSHTAGWAVWVNPPFGQSFTATANEPKTSIVSFLTSNFTNPQNPDPTFEVDLRSGEGFSGPILGSLTSVVPHTTPINTWVDFQFSSPVSLTAGQI